MAADRLALAWPVYGDHSGYLHGFRRGLRLRAA
jgi:hypothetical protein